MKFIINVPEGKTFCLICPWLNNQNVCKYCSENEICSKLNFNNLHIEEYNEEN